MMACGLTESNMNVGLVYNVYGWRALHTGKLGIFRILLIFRVCAKFRVTQQEAYHA